MAFNPAFDHGKPIRGKQFEEIRTLNTQRNKFNLSFSYRSTFNQGWLYPIVSKEVAPGDTWNMSLSAILRARPLQTPMFQNVNIDLHAWFVPYRLIWSNWEKFRTLGNGTLSMEEQKDFVPPEPPSFSVGQALETAYFYNGETVVSKKDFLANRTVSEVEHDLQLKLLDCLGLPSPIAYGDSDMQGGLQPYVNFTDYPMDKKLLAFKLRAYYKIWYDSYRDQNNYSSPEPVDSDGTLDDEELYNISHLKPRAWNHDYFTSALYSPQRGLPVSFSLVGEGDVSFKGLTYDHPDSSVLLSQDVYYNERTGHVFYRDAGNTAKPLEDGTIKIDFSSVAAVTIEQLRQAERLQEWQEVQARCGSRYSEFLRGHFNVISPDARLQRPEYIAGGRIPLTISEVMNQNGANNSVLGSYAGRATGAKGNLDNFSYYAHEDGIIMVLLSIIPETSYSQGIAREWTRFDPLDYLNPRFAQLGEQPVYLEELYATNDTAPDSDDEKPVFGYQSRYQEYKYSPDEIHGEFRGTEYKWTLSRLFNYNSEGVGARDLPQLGFDFISCVSYQAGYIGVPSPSPEDVASYQGPVLFERDNSQYRAFYVTDPYVDHYYGDVWCDIVVDRELPEYNVPTLS